LGREVGETEDSVEEMGEEYDSDRGQFFEDFTSYEVIAWRFSGVELEDGSMDGTRWRRAVSFNPRPLCCRYKLGRRMGGYQSRFGDYGEEKNHFAPMGNLTPAV
jgi:hypothetical protein